MPIPLAAGILIGLGAVIWLGRTATRHGYESAKYDVVLEDGDVQVRQYAPHTLVQTPMATHGNDGSSFKRLFRYISGDNARSEKIAMTTPVFMSPAGHEPGSAAGTMAFVVPAEATAGGAPMASSPDVTLQTIDRHAVVSMRFRGYRKAEATREAERELRAWMEQRGVVASGPARLAFYDPPWTPEFLRRNEVQIPVILSPGALPHAG